MVLSAQIQRRASVIGRANGLDRQDAEDIETGGGTVLMHRHSIGERGFMAGFTDPEWTVIALREKSEKNEVSRPRKRRASISDEEWTDLLRHDNYFIRPSSRLR